MEKTICEYEDCENVLTKRQLQKSQRFCRSECWAESKRKYQPHECERVGCEQITTNPKFCGHSCSAIATNLVRHDSSKTIKVGKDSQGKERYKEIPQNNCLNCKSLCFRKYCDQVCQGRFQRELAAWIWLSGDLESATSQSPSTLGEIKTWVVRWLKEQCDYTCSECGWREFHKVDGRPGVQVDHINGDNKDHRPENLRVLCPNCHWATETYCGRNIEAVYEDKLQYIHAPAFVVELEDTSG